jgi:hypothetical protein
MNRYVYIRDDDTPELMESLFTADGEFDLSRFPGFEAARGIDAIKEVCRSFPRPRPIHLTCNTMVLDGDGDTVRLRSRYIATYDDGRYSAGEYRDDAVRTEDGWRLERRVAVPFAIGG